MTGKFFLIFLFLFGVFLFALLDMRDLKKRNKKKHNLKSRFDSLIPFVPAFVLPYLGLFPFIMLAGILTFSTAYAEQYYLSMACGMFLAAISWYFFPAGTERTNPDGPRVLEKIVSWVYHHDKRQNAFPSSHVFTATLSAHYLALAFPELSLVWWAMGLTIAASTLFMKQHYIIDVIVGFAWVPLSIFVAQFILALLG